MTVPCRICHKALSGENKVTGCSRADCWLDFSREIPVREVVAIPAPVQWRIK